MRIVSQNRTFSANLDMIILELCDNLITCVIPGMPARFLGKYKTAKRASEVFMGIHDAYGKGLQTITVLGKPVEIFEPGKTEVIASPCRVFEEDVFYMPEE